METVIVIMSIVFGFITLMVVISSYFSYKEKELMVKQGASPVVVEKMLQKDDESEPKTKLGNLRSGVTLIAVGGAISIGLSLIDFGPWILGGLIPLFLGIGRIILYYILPEEDE